MKTFSEDVRLRQTYSSGSRRLQDVFKTSSEDEDERRLQDVFIKTNVCWDPPSCILLPLPHNASRLLLPKRLLKWANSISFRKYKRKVVLVVIYLFHYNSSKSTFFMLNMAFGVLSGPLHALLHWGSKNFSKRGKFKAVWSNLI